MFCNEVKRQFDEQNIIDVEELVSTNIIIESVDETAEDATTTDSIDEINELSD